jgi:hypothetical protein
MRKASDCHYKTDWTKFAQEDRQKMHIERLVDEGKVILFFSCVYA